MNNKALYWIALGTFAFALNGEFQKGNLPVMSRVADHAEAAFCHVMSTAGQTLALARAFTGRADAALDEDVIARQEAKMDRVMAQHQASLARVVARRQAALARLQSRMDRVTMLIDRARPQKMFQMTRVRVGNDAGRGFVFCPQTGTRISIDDEPGVTVNVAVEDEQ